jgi:hypothetical protein
VAAARGRTTFRFGPDGDEQSDKDVWMAVGVDDVDEVHRHCVRRGLDVTSPSTDLAWNIPEMHMLHPCQQGH